MGVGVQILTSLGEPVAPTGADDGLWVLEEARTYHVHSRSSALLSAKLDLLELRRIDANTFELPLGHWTTDSHPLRVVSTDAVVDAIVRVTPRSEKLDLETWVQLVAELDAWLPGISVGAAGGTAGGLGISGTESPGFAAAALLPLAPALLVALRRVTVSPREQTIELVEDLPLRSIRRADASATAWLTRHPSSAAAVDAWASLQFADAEPELPHTRTEDVVDHPVNRYVAWALERARRTLVQLETRLLAMATRSGEMDDTKAWCHARARAAGGFAAELAHLRARSFLRRVPSAPPGEAALLALQDDPIYSRFHQLVRPFLNPRYRSDADDQRIPARPTFELYELWTFLALARAFARNLPGWVSTWSHRTSPDFSGGMGEGTSVELANADEKLSLHFNRTFRSFYARPDEGPYSISAERRPDIVVEYVGKSRAPAWVFADAKYRVSRAALSDAFESVHIYRDALRWPARGGKCVAGYLLVPAMHDDAAVWFSDEFRAAHLCGCVAMRPGVDVGGFVAVVLEHLAADAR